MSNIPDVLASHFSCTIGSIPEDQQKATIRRKHVWPDTKRALSRLSFNESIGLDITFVGEPAVDVGGPL